MVSKSRWLSMVVKMMAHQGVRAAANITVFYIYYMSCTRPEIDLYLVVEFSVKWNANGLQK